MQPSTKSKEMHAQGDCVRITRGIAVVGQVSSRCGQPAACRSVAQAPIFIRLSLGHCLEGNQENCGSPCIGTTSAVHRRVHRSKHSSLNLASVLVSVFGL